MVKESKRSFWGFKKKTEGGKKTGEAPPKPSAAPRRPSGDLVPVGANMHILKIFFLQEDKVVKWHSRAFRQYISKVTREPMVIVIPSGETVKQKIVNIVAGGKESLYGFHRLVIVGENRENLIKLNGNEEIPASYFTPDMIADARNRERDSEEIKKRAPRPSSRAAEESSRPAGAASEETTLDGFDDFFKPSGREEARETEQADESVEGWLSEPDALLSEPEAEQPLSAPKDDAFTVPEDLDASPLFGEDEPVMFPDEDEPDLADGVEKPWVAGSEDEPVAAEESVAEVSDFEDAPIAPLTPIEEDEPVAAEESVAEVSDFEDAPIAPLTPIEEDEPVAAEKDVEVSDIEAAPTEEDESVAAEESVIGALDGEPSYDAGDMSDPLAMSGLGDVDPLALDAEDVISAEPPPVEEEAAPPPAEDEIAVASEEMVTIEEPTEADAEPPPVEEEAAPPPPPAEEEIAVASEEMVTLDEPTEADAEPPPAEEKAEDQKAASAEEVVRPEEPEREWRAFDKEGSLFLKQKAKEAGIAEKMPDIMLFKLQIHLKEGDLVRTGQLCIKNRAPSVFFSLTGEVVRLTPKNLFAID